MVEGGKEEAEGEEEDWEEENWCGQGYCDTAPKRAPLLIGVALGAGRLSSAGAGWAGCSGLSLGLVDGHCQRLASLLLGRTVRESLISHPRSSRFSRQGGPEGRQCRRILGMIEGKKLIGCCVSAEVLSMHLVDTGNRVVSSWPSCNFLSYSACLQLVPSCSGLKLRERLLNIVTAGWSVLAGYFCLTKLFHSLISDGLM